MSESIEQIRQKTAAILSRINSDAEFKAQVLNDPEATLMAAGLPAEAISAFIARQESGEVNGYLMCFTTCYNSTAGCLPNTY